MVGKKTPYLSFFFEGGRKEGPIIHLSSSPYGSYDPYGDGGKLQYLLIDKDLQTRTHRLLLLLLSSPYWLFFFFLPSSSLRSSKIEDRRSKIEDRRSKIEAPSLREEATLHRRTKEKTLRRFSEGSSPSVKRGRRPV